MSGSALNSIDFCAANSAALVSVSRSWSAISLAAAGRTSATLSVRRAEGGRCRGRGRDGRRAPAVEMKASSEASARENRVDE